MATTTIQIGSQAVRIRAQPLTPEAFSAFGSVTQNARPDVHPSQFAQHASSLPSNAYTANQGYAIQYRSAARIVNLYDQAPSGSGGDPALSVFVCASRPLAHPSPAVAEFEVKYLERHPYTTQTFTPLASTASAYLVIVAPTLPPAAADAGFPVPTQGQGLPGRGLPDLQGLRAFVATSAQAVTYGAGTWHAPMAVLGREGTTLDFVVSQFTSGVAEEDCQLLEFDGAKQGALTVEIPQDGRLENL